MKVAVASTGKDINSNVSNVFGRAPYFIIAEIKDKIMNIEPIENIYANQMGRAGISTAQLIAEKNVKAVIAGNVGPRAFEVLSQFNIKIYNASGSVKEALQKFQREMK